MVRSKAVASCFVSLLALTASPALASTTLNWDPQVTDTGYSSDFDVATQTFTPVNADTLTFGFDPNEYQGGGYYHSHGYGNGFSISAIVNSVSQVIYTSGPVSGDYGLNSIGPINFSGGSVSGIKLSSNGYVGNAFHNFSNQSFTLSSVNNAVPEPATWALLLVGFGFVGGAMRTRRKQNVTISYA